MSADYTGDVIFGSVEDEPMGYRLKELLERGNPYDGQEVQKVGVVALTAGEVPDLPPDWASTGGGSFGAYALNVFELARSVIIWWTPSRVEHEALRLAGDVEGPSVLSQEAYAFRGIYLHIASLIAQSVYRVASHLSGVRAVEMLHDLLHETVITLERKAQQVESRAMDLRLRYDAQKLRALLGALDVSPKLEQLIEAAQRDTETKEHLVSLAGEVAVVLKETARDTASIKFIADAHWDRVLDKDAEAKKLSATLNRLGDKVTDATLKAFFAALLHKVGL